MVSPWTSPLAQLAPACCQWATVQVRYSAKLQAVLAQLELSLLLSTGQAGQLISIGSHQVGLCAGCRALPGGWIAIGAMPQWASVASAAPASPRRHQPRQLNRRQINRKQMICRQQRASRQPPATRQQPASRQNHCHQNHCHQNRCSQNRCNRLSTPPLAELSQRTRRQLHHLPQAVALICESLIPDPASPQHPA